MPPTKYGLKYLPVEKLIAPDWNPQEMKDPEFQRLVEEMKTVGCIVPLTVKPAGINSPAGMHLIVGGSHRWKAAQLAGLSELPCLLVEGSMWDDPDLVKFTNVRLNVIQGRLNPEKFIKLYNELSEKYGVEAMQKLLGFTDSHVLQKIIGQVKKGIKQALPKEIQEEFQKNAKEIKSVEELSQIIEKMFATYGDTVQSNYMVFTHGGMEHIYVSMDVKLKKKMDKALEFCRQTGTDICSFLSPAIDDHLKEVEPVLKDAVSKKKDKSFEDPE